MEKIKRTYGDLNPSIRLRRLHVEHKSLEESDLNKYLKLRSISGLSDSWLYDIKATLKSYINYVGWSIDEDKTLDYLQHLQERYTTTSYRKRVYQIRKFIAFLHIDWASNIIPPSEPNYISKRVTKNDIDSTLSYFKGNKFFKQIKAVIMLGATSGIRAEELYQLNIEDIDVENRIIYINHNPTNGQTTKTLQSRISFFTKDAKDAFIEYLYYHNGCELDRLFPRTHIIHLFSNAPIRVKDLRKYFSQQWDRRGGPTSIKKLIMGHSTRGDVDLMHYNCQSEEDLKKIYDKVMCSKE